MLHCGGFVLLFFLFYLYNSGFIRFMIGWRGGEACLFYSRTNLLSELRSVLFALHYKCLREQIYLRVRDSFDAFRDAFDRSGTSRAAHSFDRKLNFHR